MFLESNKESGEIIEPNSITNFHATTSGSTNVTQQLHFLNLNLNNDRGIVLKTRSPNSSASTATPDMNKVGKSVFYDCLDASPMAEKQDNMKPEDDDDCRIIC